MLDQAVAIKSDPCTVGNDPSFDISLIAPTPFVLAIQTICRQQGWCHEACMQGRVKVKATKPPEAKAGPKVKAKAKSKSKVGKPAASESAASAAVPKGKAKAKSVAKPKASPKPPAPTTVLKRPSALKAVSAAEPPGGERLTVHKGLYKDGKYGFKVNGREVYRVPRLKLVLIYM